jgi:transcriptional regulator of acetoin/glycerol metabolism
VSIDWDTTGSMLQGWGAIGGVAAILYAAWKGGQTFESWKRQKLAERKLQQAERILTASYKARQALAYVRGVVMWGHELQAAEVKLKEDEEQWAKQTEHRQKRLVTAQAYYNRLNKTKAEQDELFECLPMARALFGVELEKSIENLIRQFRMVEVNVDSYIDDQGEDAEFSKQIRRAMYDVDPGEGEKNEISTAISTALNDVETTCLPVLR